MELILVSFFLVKITDNVFGDAGVKYIANALITNTTLLELDLRGKLFWSD